VEHLNVTRLERGGEALRAPILFGDSVPIGKPVAEHRAPVDAVRLARIELRAAESVMVVSNGAPQPSLREVAMEVARRREIAIDPARGGLAANDRNSDRHH